MSQALVWAAATQRTALGGEGAAGVPSPPVGAHVIITRGVQVAGPCFWAHVSKKRQHCSCCVRFEL